MRNKVKLIATAAVTAGVVSLGASALAGSFSPFPGYPGTGNADPEQTFEDYYLSTICEGGHSTINEWIGPLPGQNFWDNCSGG